MLLLCSNYFRKILFLTYATFLFKRYLLKFDNFCPIFENALCESASRYERTWNLLQKRVMRIRVVRIGVMRGNPVPWKVQDEIFWLKYMVIPYLFWGFPQIRVSANKDKGLQSFYIKIVVTSKIAGFQPSNFWHINLYLILLPFLQKFWVWLLAHVRFLWDCSHTLRTTNLSFLSLKPSLLEPNYKKDVKTIGQDLYDEVLHVY